MKLILKGILEKNQTKQMQAEIEQRERDEKLEFDKLVEQVKKNVAEELKKQYLALI